MKLASLEVVRGLAALFVVLAHLAKLIDGYPVHIQAVAMLSNLATEAVIVFFVLSGAVITLSQQARRRSPAAYLGARLRRILPTYFVALALAWVAAAVTSWPMPGWAQLAGHLAFLQSLQGWIVPVVSTNDPLWTLGYETWFYLAFVAVILHPLARWVWLAVAAAAGGLTYALGPALPGAAHHLCWAAAFSLFWVLGHLAATLRDRIAPGRAAGIAFLAAGFLWSRAWTGLAGGFYDFGRWAGFALGTALFIASLLQPADRLAPKGWAAAARAACAMGLVLCWRFSASPPSIQALLLLLAVAAIVVTDGALARLYAALQPLRRALVWTGDISFGVYALHFPVILVVNHALAGHGVAVRVAASLAVTLLAAWLVDAPTGLLRRPTRAPAALGEAR